MQTYGTTYTTMLYIKITYQLAIQQKVLREFKLFCYTISHIITDMDDKTDISKAGPQIIQTSLSKHQQSLKDTTVEFDSVGPEQQLKGILKRNGICNGMNARMASSG